MSIRDLFSDEKVNTGRQIELDIAKGLSIIFMVFINFLILVGDFNHSTSFIYNILFADVLGGPCPAPIFMFCMGVGIVYSRHSQWDTMIKRGCILYLTGILVNLFEYVLPYFTSGSLLGRWDLYHIHGGLIFFFCGILIFAGLSFVLIGILKKFELSNKWLIIIALAMSLIGSLLRCVDFGTPVLNIFIGYFIGTNTEYTAFPLFNWFIFPISGLIWGQYFIRVKNKAQFFKYWPIFIILVIIYFGLSPTLWGKELFSSRGVLYYYMTTLDAILCIIYIHGVMGLCYYLAKYLPDRINKVFSTLSSNINRIYIGQSFFIPLTIIGLAYIFKDILFTDLTCAIFSILILIVSTACAILYKKLRTG